MRHNVPPGDSYLRPTHLSRSFSRLLNGGPWMQHHVARRAQKSTRIYSPEHFNQYFILFFAQAERGCKASYALYFVFRPIARSLLTQNPSYFHFCPQAGQAPSQNKSVTTAFRQDIRLRFLRFFPQGFIIWLKRGNPLWIKGQGNSSNPFTGERKL
jgi:hypothetical protein